MAVVAGQPSLIPMEPAVQSQTIEIGQPAVSSEKFHAGTHFIRLHVEEDCHVAFGREACSNDTKLPMDSTEFFGVRPGTTMSVIGAES